MCFFFLTKLEIFRDLYLRFVPSQNKVRFCNKGQADSPFQTKK